MKNANCLGEESMSKDKFPPFAEGSETSEEAAQSMEKEAPQLRTRVLRYIMDCGERGATCWEVETALRMQHQTASPRIWELKGRRLVVGTKERRKTASGRSAQVLVAVGNAALVEAAKPLTLREQNRALLAENAELRSEINRLRERLRMLSIRDRKRDLAARQMPLRGIADEEEEP